MATTPPTVLVVDDDPFVLRQIAELLQDRCLYVVTAGSEVEAMQRLQEAGDKISVALVDIRLPKRSPSTKQSTDSGQGHGYRLSRHIKANFPKIRIIGMSFFASEEVRDWFLEHTSGFLRKNWLTDGATEEFINSIERTARKRTRRIAPRSFIVHGHDTNAVRQLQKFIRQTLKWPAATVLRDLPFLGRTIIEKFEDTAKTADIAFVLLTPDDVGASAKDDDAKKRRARQNVIFELGYFYAKLQRKGGRVILLHKGRIELPSDISGIGYVDITNGIAASGSAISVELSKWLG